MAPATFDPLFARCAFGVAAVLFLASPARAQSHASGAAATSVLEAAPIKRLSSIPKASPQPAVPLPKVNDVGYAPIKPQAEVARIPEIDMFVGESRVFPAPGVARIAVGNGQIMTATALDDDGILIFANAAGTSTLFVWNQDGKYQKINVIVSSVDTSRVAREVAAFLAAIPKANVSIVGDKVIVEGEELSDADRDKIIELAKRYPQIINFTSPIGWEQMVMMDVKVVEFPKTELREMGLKWRAAGGAAIGAVWNPGGRGDASGQVLNQATGVTLPITPLDTTKPLPSALTILTGINLGLNAQLTLLEQDGKASILAEPQLSTRSGYHASFLAGGEFPYSVATVNGVTVLFKPYGIKLDIEPKVGRNGVIRAVVDAEVSAIDASVSTTSGPALTSRRTKTEFNVRNGETIVLSGLLQRSASTDIDKVPFLGDIPILGALFRSKRFQNKETELVVFVTPSIVDSRNPVLQDRVARASARLAEQLDKPPFLSQPLQPGQDAGTFNAPATSAPSAPHP